MVDRFLVWVAAGVLAAGVSAATVAGGGVAVADDSAGADGKADATSESTDAGSVESDSEVDKAGVADVVDVDANESEDAEDAEDAEDEITEDAEDGAIEEKITKDVADTEVAEKETETTAPEANDHDTVVTESDANDTAAAPAAKERDVTPAVIDETEESAETADAAPTPLTAAVEDETSAPRTFLTARQIGGNSSGKERSAPVSAPASVPLLHIAGEPTVINNGGDASQAILEKRPGQFNGVRLIGGSHSDAFQSSAYFGLVQAFVGLVFGQSTPENVEAVQVLSQGWLTDMYAGRVYDPATRTGIYGDPGQPGETVIDIPTDAGLARGYVLPGPPPALSPIERFFAALLQSINSNDFITCSTEPTAAGSCAGSIVA